jgi:hypothetical protein
MRTHPFSAGARPAVFASVARKRLFTRARVINLVSVAVLLAVGAASMVRAHGQGVTAQHALAAPGPAALSAPVAVPAIRHP